MSRLADLTLNVTPRLPEAYCKVRPGPYTTSCIHPEATFRRHGLPPLSFWQP